MVRIRYNWHWKDSLITSNPILAGHDVFTIVISFKHRIKYSIMNSKWNSIHNEDCKNVIEAKRKAKAYLKNLGAVFFDEVRRK